MNANTMQNLSIEGSKVRRFGWYLGLVIALYIGAVMLFIIAY
jgi:hypothetical protein